MLHVVWHCQRILEEHANESSVPKPLVKNLASQFQQISNLLALPADLLSWGTGTAIGLLKAVEIVDHPKSQFDELDASELLAPAKLLPHEKKPISRLVNKLRKNYIHRLKKLSLDELFRPELKTERSIQALLFAAVVCTWTSFESFASDLWVAMLNKHACPLAQRVLVSLDGDETGLSSKHIEVGLAARHNFDLRHCLGTLLRERFDFTSVKGIAAAYQCAFGACKLSEDPKTKSLYLLEQLRHLIVHRGGLVDDKFIKATGLKVRRGASITMKPVEIGNYVFAAAIGSAVLLETVEEWSKQISVRKR